MGLATLHLAENAPVSPALRELLTAAIPSSVRQVTMVVPGIPCASVAFNAARHALGVADWATAQDNELRRLQLLSQWLAVVETSQEWRRALEQHGLALLLFPPLAGNILALTNKVRGRVASASLRNALAHYHAVALALCRWLHVVEQLRQPLHDWYETTSKGFEREARAAKRLYRQAALADGSRRTTDTDRKSVV